MNKKIKLHKIQVLQKKLKEEEERKRLKEEEDQKILEKQKEEAKKQSSSFN